MNLSMSKTCSIDVWLLTFLSALLAFSYSFELIPGSSEWVSWPITISLGSTMISVIGLEMAVRRLPTPESIQGARRVVLYVAAFINGIILNYAVTPARIGPRGFRISIFVGFGLPLFVWLFHHIRRHDRQNGISRAIARRTVGVGALVLGVLYLVATAFSPTE